MTVLLIGLAACVPGLPASVDQVVADTHDTHSGPATGHTSDTGTDCESPWVGGYMGNQYDSGLDELFMLVAGFVGGDFDDVIYIVECPTCVAEVERHPIGPELVDEEGFYRLELLFRDEYEPGVSTTANPLTGRGEDGVAVVEVTGPCGSACRIMGDPELGHPETWDCDQVF